MKILAVCEQGNNRSVQLAHRLKYWGHDVLPVGLATTTDETMTMLFNWADYIILCGVSIASTEYAAKIKVFLEPGPDIYKRPFNLELDGLVKAYLQANKDWLKK